MDERTYTNSEIEIAKKFKNGKHVIIENAGHDLYMQSPIIEDLVWDFFMGKEPNNKRMVIEPTIFE